MRIRILYTMSLASIHSVQREVSRRTYKELIPTRQEIELFDDLVCFGRTVVGLSVY